MHLFLGMFLVYSALFGLLCAVVVKEAWKKYYLPAKALNSFAFLAVFAASAEISGNRTVFLLLLPAFLCCFAGDILLAFYRGRKSRIYFVLGLLIFLTGHLFFIRWLCMKNRITIVDFLFPTAAVILIWVMVSGKGFHTGKIKPLILAYTFFVSLLFAKAVHNAGMSDMLEDWAAAAGAALFLMSDTSILFLYFYKKPGKKIHLFNLSAYYYAMFLLGTHLLFL